jgi:hypothetical protein
MRGNQRRKEIKKIKIGNCRVPIIGKIAWGRTIRNPILSKRNQTAILCSLVPLRKNISLEVSFPGEVSRLSELWVSRSLVGKSITSDIGGALIWLFI